MTAGIHFCDVILPLSVKGAFTYSIPVKWQNLIQIGMRVEVQFGKRKLYTAIVKSLHQQKPAHYQVKDILDVVDLEPIVTENQLRFWEWMAEYYCCSIGEVMTAALPSFFRPDSETIYIKYPDSQLDILNLSDDEYLIAEAFEHQEILTLKDIQAILQKKTVAKVIKSLIEKEVIALQEFVEEKYQPKTETFTRLLPKYIENSDEQKDLFEQKKRSPKQTDLLLYFLYKYPQNTWVSRSQLLRESNINGAVHAALVKENIFINEEKVISRVQDEKIVIEPITLSSMQETAYQEIKTHLKTKEVVLLHGVTASGKTHVYVKLIQDVLQQGKQVLFLVPEIALTSQLVKRVEKLLGKIGVYHSKYNPAERVETWLKVISREYNVIVGARSAIFLPFKNLGLIIVDEEHDTSYKQKDPAPRYQGRDCAILLANISRAKVLLGSATPSIETWVNVQSHKYAKVSMLTRYSEVPLPQLEFIDLQEARKKKQLTGLLTQTLQDKIAEIIAQKKQVIIFQNRRGYAPYITCLNCGWIPECRHCDVSLTFHKNTEQLRCHYCGYSTHIPKKCAECGSTLLAMRGIGTERVEDDLKAVFPDAKVLRLDYDTAKSKNAYESIIQKFEDGEADILVGTQMVTKGLDFKNVDLVGVLSADALLYYPEFRAIERAYQLLSQVSGRAGRMEKQGTVAIQISNIQHPIVHFLQERNIANFYEQELQERAKYNYPPYVKLIHISMRHSDYRVVDEATHFIHKQLQLRKIGDCLHPSIPSVSKIKGKYIRDILLKLERNNKQILLAKKAIEEVSLLMYQYDTYKNVRIVLDVDP
ncbi:MAG: primosomal protein N' [Chitinophagales bacterium]|nr:primosomal protein N' [Chitinophagales bacterium]